MATYMYIISGGISCGNWNTFPGKFSVRYYYWELIVGRFSYLRNEKEV